MQTNRRKLVAAILEILMCLIWWRFPEICCGQLQNWLWESTKTRCGDSRNTLRKSLKHGAGSFLSETHCLDPRKLRGHTKARCEELPKRTMGAHRSILWVLSKHAAGTRLAAGTLQIRSGYLLTTLQAPLKTLRMVVRTRWWYPPGPLRHPHNWLLVLSKPLQVPPSTLWVPSRPLRVPPKHAADTPLTCSG